MYHWYEQTIPVVPFELSCLQASPKLYSFSGGGKGAKGACVPGSTVQGAAFENMEFRYIATSGKITFALQRVIFYTHNTSLVMGPQTLTVSAPRPHTKQCVHEKLTLLI